MEYFAIVNNSFMTWLDGILAERNLTRADLARRAGIGQSTLSLIGSGDRNPGSEVCLAIARALKIPPEEVLRVAGILPPVRSGSALDDRIVHLMGLLSDDEKNMLLEFSELLVHRREKSKNASAVESPGSA
jgi:transcriptional regulator with XRE-family HTH domain